MRIAGTPGSTPRITYPAGWLRVGGARAVLLLGQCRVLFAMAREEQDDDTLEAIEADVLLHVVDAADPDFRRQMIAVEQVLEEILERPRPALLVFNKADRLEPEVAAGLHVEFPDSFVISARRGEGVHALRGFLWEESAASGRKRAS